MEFTADDFKNMDWENDLPVRESAAREANIKLKNWLDVAPTVFSRSDQGCWYGMLPDNDALHTAKLVRIEKIKK